MTLKKRVRLVGGLLASAFGASVAAQSPVQQAGLPKSLADSTPLNTGLPLVPTRRIRFTVDEGTWLSVDVSPDGRTIVFDLLGDLYALPVTGGRSTRLTSGIAVDRQPRFSPDGKRILFLSDRRGTDDIWLIDADGTHPRPVTRADTAPSWDHRYVSAVWLPDGAHLLVSRKVPAAFGYDLIVYDTTGTVAPAYHPTSSIDVLSVGGFSYTAAPSVTRDGGLVYATQTTGNRSPVRMPSGLLYQVVAVNLRTGRRTVVTDEPEGAVQPVVSPDGRYLVYATEYPSMAGLQTGLRLLDQQNGSVRWLVPRITPSMQRSFVFWSFGQLPNPAFTPDGQAIVLAYEGKMWRVAVPSGVTTEVPFTVEVDQALGPLLRFPMSFDDSILTVRVVRDVRFAPDGRRAAFVALGRVWVMAWPGGRPRRVTSGTSEERVTEHAPAWSPDGRYLAYLTWSEHGGYVYRVLVDAVATSRAAPEQLTAAADYYDKLVYAPDGQTLICMRAPWRRMHDPQGRIVPQELVALNGGEARVLSELGTNAYGYGWPHFSRRDTSRVYIYGVDTLWAVARDGSGAREAVASVGPLWPPVNVDLLVSPVGDRALFVAGSMIALVAIPRDSHLVRVAYDYGNAESRDPAAARQWPITPQGGEFPWWSADGQAFTYTLGNMVFTQALPPEPQRGSVDRLTPPVRSEVRIRVPKDRPNGTLLLRGARVLTMRGGQVLERGDVLVRGNRIAALGPQGMVAVPPGTAVRDVTGSTILPGYVATHEHIDAPYNVHAPRVWQYLLTLAYGVTTILDPQTESSADKLAYADMLETGALLGPRHFTTGTAVMVQRMTTWDETRDVVQRYSRYYATGLLKSRDAGARELRQWVARAAGEERLTSVGHWYQDLVSMVLDGYSGLEHASFIPLHSDVLQLWAQAGIIYTPTTMVASLGPAPLGYFSQQTDWARETKVARFGAWRGLAKVLQPHLSYYPLALRRDYSFPREAANAARLVAAGGRVGVATDGVFPGLGDHWEMWALAMGGMPLADVLRSATLTGAEAIGMEREVGSIEPGKLADLQVLDRNPLEDIHNTNSVRYVMKNGRLYDANTLDEVWPRRRPLFANGERPWWWDELPPNVR